MLTTHVAVSECSNGLDIHDRIGNKLLELRESRCVVIFDKLAMETLSQRQECVDGEEAAHLVDDEDFIVHIHRQVVCLNDESILWVQMRRESHDLWGRRVRFELFNILQSRFQ